MQPNPNNLQLVLQNLANSPNYSLVGALVLFFAAMICMLCIGNPLIAWLQNKRWKKNATNEETWAVREDTPESHLAKVGTPSMGGIGIIAATILSWGAVLIALLIVNSSVNGKGVFWPHKGFGNIAFILLPIVFLSHGILGFADDWSKASGRGGLRARSKLGWQILLALAFVISSPFLVSKLTLAVNTPVVTQTSFDLLTFCVLAFVLVATCNAVNLTDGIDGLASGLAVQCGLVLFLIPSPTGIPFTIGFFCFALAGACLGFLKFNRYKARVFMGDTGSLAIGAALGAGAILQGAVFLLPFIGFIYFVEMFSVISQVLWFKWTKRQTGEGKRLFRRAPLHHHFEMGGWSEWRVVGTFWAVNLVTSAIGLLLWHNGVLPRWP